MDKLKWMIYGANGYTGKLLIEEAVKRGEKPVIAGRNEESIRNLAQKYNLPFDIFSLDNPENVSNHLKDINVLLLAAGPFSSTSKIAVDACLKSKTHYLDITGEISVFEECASRNQEAINAGIMILPGVGFDVVPSDCLSASLYQALPDATHLTLAIQAIGEASPGTMKTMLENFPEGGLIRQNGKLTRVPAAWKISEIPFKNKSKLAMTIPWGDVSTAYTSTNIPNIAVYMVLPKNIIRISKLMSPVSKVFGIKLIQDLVKNLIETNVKGPKPEEREKGKSYLWGMVENSQGKKVEGFLETSEGYKLTSKTGVDIALRVMKGDFKTGYQTPSLAYGADYIKDIEGSKLEIQDTKY